MVCVCVVCVDVCEFACWGSCSDRNGDSLKEVNVNSIE